MKIELIPNQIINGKLTPLSLQKIDSIVLHHSAHSTATVKEIERWHINQGWNAIGYNWLVDKDGTIYRGRGFNLSASVNGHNNHLVSICFLGDYDNIDKVMPTEQYNSGIDIIDYIKPYLPNCKRIVGHKYFGGSICPGKYFPLENMQKLKKISNEEENEMVYNYIDKNMPEWARPTIQKLCDKGYLKGNERGELQLTDTMLKLLVINDRAGLYN